MERIPAGTHSFPAAQRLDLLLGRSRHELSAPGTDPYGFPLVSARSRWILRVFAAAIVRSSSRPGSPRPALPGVPG